MLIFKLISKQHYLNCNYTVDHNIKMTQKHIEDSSSSSSSSEVCSVCSQRYSVSSSSDEVLKKHDVDRIYIHSLEDLNEDLNEGTVTGMSLFTLLFKMSGI